jgi:very-short-patch-repair endonuclease
VEKKDLEKDLKDCSWYLEEFLKLPSKVQELLLINNIHNKIYPTIFCEGIQSPIEQIFITAFELYMQFLNKEYIFLFSQKEIFTNEKRYIVDFFFESDQYVNLFETNKKIIIECDGYNFHQKTKEQIKHDNEREYDLKMAGYEIIRFSGSQIYNEPFKCAEDTYNYIMHAIEMG